MEINVDEEMRLTFEMEINVKAEQLRFERENKIKINIPRVKRRLLGLGFSI
jgi:predicted GNAT family acetyltransferase